MENFAKEKIKFFLGGAIAGGVPAGFKLFTFPPLWSDVGGLVMEYSIRFIGTIMIALSSGMLTIMAKDFYDIKIKKRFHNYLNKKSKENGKRRKDAA